MAEIYSYKFNSARNALRVLVRELQISKIHIPYYICPEIKNALKKENCKVEFYHIDSNFYPLKEFKNSDYILYPNYFGVCTKNIKRLETIYPNVIIDNAHSFYSEHSGLASFNSYRKFFFHNYGLKDGSNLTVNKPLNQKFKEDTSSYIQIKNDFSYSSLLKNERRVDKFDILKLSNTSKKILSEIDIEEDKKIRRKNFFELNRKYKSANELKIELRQDEIPFVYPLLTHNKDLQEEISTQNELIFRYWSNMPENYPEYDFYKNLLPIPLVKNQTGQFHR